MATHEEVTEEVISSLIQLKGEELLNVAALLEIPEEKVKKAKSKGRTGVLRLVTSFMMSEDVDGRPEEGMEMLQRVQGKMKERATGKEEKRKEGKVSQPTVVNSPPAGSSVLSVDQLRKEFKIKGQIGDPGQKDKLPFSSLVHQIDFERLPRRGYCRRYHHLYGSRSPVAGLPRDKTSLEPASAA